MYAPLMISVIATVASMSQPNVLAIAVIIDAFGILLTPYRPSEVLLHISGKATTQELGKPISHSFQFDRAPGTIYTLAVSKQSDA
jgi:hypothetical protein